MQLKTNKKIKPVIYFFSLFEYLNTKGKKKTFWFIVAGNLFKNEKLLFELLLKAPTKTICFSIAFFCSVLIELMYSSYPCLSKGVFNYGTKQNEFLFGKMNIKTKRKLKKGKKEKKESCYQNETIKTFKFSIVLENNILWQ